MKLNFFKSIFKENNSSTLLESTLIKNIKKLSDSDNLFVYENITIYHLSKKIFIPLLILDNYRGIYLFEYKEWSFNELKKASIKKASKQDSSKETLAFQKVHEFIKIKLDNLPNKEDINIFNFLLMQNLNTDEYEHLDFTFRKLLPKSRIIFNDMSIDDIEEKLSTDIKKNNTLLDVKTIMGSLLGQYTMLKDNGDFVICRDEQIGFLEQKLENIIVLNTPPSSGKTGSILLKAIVEKLKNPTLKIIIMQVTSFASSKLKDKLLNTLEKAKIELTVDDIEIITPLDLINKHLKKLNKAELEVILHIDAKLMKDNFKVADLILCDDTNLLPFLFIEYIKHIQKKSYLILVQNYFDKSDNATTYHLSKNFRIDKQKVIFKESNPHAKALQLIDKLLETNQAKDILVITDNLRKKRLAEDLEFFIKDKVLLLDTSKSYFEQDIDGLKLISYNQIAGMESKFVILLDTCASSTNEVHYGVGLSTDTSYVVFDKETEDIKELKVSFENR